MIQINDNLCISCGKCVDVCPEGFVREGDRVRVKNPDAPCVEKAIAACPQNAIQLDPGDHAFPADPGSPPMGSGMGRGMGSGRGRGMGSGRGSGMGRGMGGGRGSGRGGGRGR